MIEIKNVSKNFESEGHDVQALKDVSLAIEDNEVFGIIGESGAGKSTLLRSINGLVVPTAGEIWVDGTNILELNKKNFRAFQKKTAMIFQQYNLLSNQTVYDNVKLPLELHDFVSTLTVEDVLDFVGLLDKKDAYPAQLSGGQQQRVGIARALITEPQFLLCDEPTSALDTNTTQEIVKVLQKAQETFNMTTLVVTHELEVVKQLTSRAAIMQAGRVEEVIDVKRTDDIFQGESYIELAKEVLGNE